MQRLIPFCLLLTACNSNSDLVCRQGESTLVTAKAPFVSVPFLGMNVIDTHLTSHSNAVPFCGEDGEFDEIDPGDTICVDNISFEPYAPCISEFDLTAVHNFEGYTDVVCTQRSSFDVLTLYTDTLGYGDDHNGFTFEAYLVERDLVVDLRFSIPVPEADLAAFEIMEVIEESTANSPGTFVIAYTFHVPAPLVEQETCNGVICDNTILSYQFWPATGRPRIGTFSDCEIVP